MRNSGRILRNGCDQATKGSKDNKDTFDFYCFTSG
jgi:hypothetical protein